jgi:hypothetical protein
VLEHYLSLRSFWLCRVTIRDWSEIWCFGSLDQMHQLWKMHFKMWKHSEINFRVYIWTILFTHKVLWRKDVLPHDPISRSACLLCKDFAFTFQVRNLVHAWTLDCLPTRLHPRNPYKLERSVGWYVSWCRQKDKSAPAVKGSCTSSGMFGRSGIEESFRVYAWLTLRWPKSHTKTFACELWHSVLPPLSWP